MKNIGVLIPATTKNRDWTNFKETDLYEHLFNSFFKTYNKEHIYTIYLGIDVNDRFYTKHENQEEIIRFISVMTNTNIKFINFDRKWNGNVCHIWNELHKIAFDENNDYFVQIGSDIRFMSEGWVNSCIQKLDENDGVGVVGLTDEGRRGMNPNDTLLTQTFVSREHMKIFNFYYPPDFKNWFIDDWISEIYELNNFKFIVPHKIFNLGGEPRYKIYGDRGLCTENVIKYKEHINTYLNLQEKIDNYKG